MPALNEKFAAALEDLHAVAGQNKRRVFKSSEFSRLSRKRLVQYGFLNEVIKGWLISARPDEKDGDTTSWYASFWEFCKFYLDDRFGSDWALSPEASILLLAGDFNVPRQVVVQAPGGSNLSVVLPHASSLFAYRTALPRLAWNEILGLRCYPAPQALIGAAPNFWVTNAREVISVLGSVNGSAPFLSTLLGGGHVAAASRLAGGYRKLGRERVADEIIAAMKRGGHDVREDADPFKQRVPEFQKGARSVSAVMTRIRLMWAQMRDVVIDSFPMEPSLVNDKDGYLEALDERYESDAYHSLSIEGYSVSARLIERVRNGDWNPQEVEGDRNQADAMAAKGYWQAFQLVREGVARVLNGEDAATVAEEAHQSWFGAMFEPSVAAGLIKPDRMVGYRSHFVFIRNSRHTPTHWQSVPDAMEAFWECLQEEPDARVRAVLGHFIFTFIHPLPDGNGRCGRFLMNLMLASGGYQWTIIPVDRRDEYMKTLEDASTLNDIRPFAQFVSSCSERRPPPPRRKLKGEEQEDEEAAAPRGFGR